MIFNFKQDLQRFLANFVYMLCALVLLETYRSIVLAQVGINHFVHGYTFAIATAVIMAKTAVLTEKLTLVGKNTSNPLIVRILLAAAGMTLLATVLHIAEDFILHGGHLHRSLDTTHAVLLALANGIALFVIFALQLILRSVDQHFGRGNLKRYFFEAEQSSKR